MRSLRRAGQDALIGFLATAALVALVLDHWIVGTVLGGLALYRLHRVSRTRVTLHVDQREADQEGKPQT